MRSHPKPQRGFSLLELLLALAIGLGFAGLMLRAMALEGPQGALLARQLRERGLQKRTHALLRLDLQEAQALRLGAGDGGACPLAGRQPLLQIATPQGPVTYTLGAAPSPIWRGRVLMRCGPAFGLDGTPSGGMAQNRVVLDALRQQGARIERTPQGMLRLILEQEFSRAGGGSQRLRSERLLAAGVLVTP